jgi:uncharacterized repeat protein (TIGR02543 family)
MRIRGITMNIFLKKAYSLLAVAALAALPACSNPTGGGGPAGYTLTFDANGGSLDAGEAVLVVDHGAAVGPLPAADRPDYRFDGWYTAANKKYTESTFIVTDLTLYAHWTALVDPLTVTFKANGGTPLGKEDHSIKSGDMVGKLPVPVRSGYDLVGWYTAANGGIQYTAASTVTGNVTLYAQWAMKSYTDGGGYYTGVYTIRFDVNGGDPLAAGLDTRSVSNGAAVGELPEPTRAHYRFDGWYSAANRRYTAASTVTGDTILSAHWTALADPITISFNVTDGDALSKTTLSVNSGDPVGNLPEPSRTGYFFDGWYTAADGGTKYTGTEPVTGGDITLYAHWILGVYTVWFDVNGGDPLGEGQETRTVDSGAPVGTPLPVPTRTHYDFDGWYGGAHDRYTGAEKVTADITLSAHWTAQIDPFTVSFDVNGGDPLEKNTLSVKSGDLIGTLPVPARAGSTFDGWFDALSGGTRYTGGETVTGDLTLYAHWTAGTHIITIDLNGGNLLGGGGQNTRIVNYGDPIGTLPTPTRTHYTFDGWYTAVDGGTQYTASTIVTGSVTLYARWTELPWIVSTLAGSAAAGHVDGIGTAAKFNSPSGLAIDGSGNLYVGDWNTYSIRKAAPQ